jgi:Rac GTPase-activating protein 1
LSKLEIHLVCGTIKYFLRSLHEHLVTNSLWHDFVKAAGNPDTDDSRVLLYQAISELPQPNRDTLAFLIMHLQRVAESPDCRMPVSNLAEVFGPLNVSSSSLDCKATQMLKEVNKQVTENLINIPWDYLANFFQADTRLVSNSPLSAMMCMLPCYQTVRTLKNSFASARG